MNIITAVLHIFASCATSQEPLLIDFSKLPEPMHGEIVNQIIDRNNVHESLGNLVIFSQTNKRFHQLICKSPAFSIQSLAKKYQVSPREIVFRLISFKRLDVKTLSKALQEDVKIEKKFLNPYATRYVGIDYKEALQLIAHPDKFVTALITGKITPNMYVGPRPFEALISIISRIKGERPELIKILIAAGSDVNAADLLGYTALYEAYYLNHETTYQLLKDAGAARVSILTGYAQANIDVENRFCLCCCRSGITLPKD